MPESHVAGESQYEQKWADEVQQQEVQRSALDQK